MEGLSLSENRLNTNDANAVRARRLYCRPPRLPTPEASRSSYETRDSESPDEGTRRGPPRLAGDERYTHPNEMSHKISRRDSRNGSTPYSPPYQSSDIHRPSLPPLKTVLGDNMSSPPRTPTTYSASMQPSPREPTYITTYKPASLYPSKKQRTDFVLEPARPFTTSTSFSSQGFPPFEPNVIVSTTPMRTDTSFLGPPTQSSLSETRRHSMQNQDTPLRARIPIRNGQYAPLSYIRGGINSIASTPNAPHHYGRTTQSSIYGSSEMDYRQNQSIDGTGEDILGRDTRAPFISRPDPPNCRRSSTNEHDKGRTHSFDRKNSMQPSYQSDERYALPLRAGFVERDAMDCYGRLHELPSLSMPEYAHASYQNAQPAFFMPSLYDYRHGKVRKRSNLPKQSTEIMKTWFDQNITNPYPSEEQKALFSNATGISTTQVSNWFINHRRRCPELRDKREKNRGRECEI